MNIIKTTTWVRFCNTATESHFDNTLQIPAYMFEHVNFFSFFLLKINNSWSTNKKTTWNCKNTHNIFASSSTHLPHFIKSLINNSNVRSEQIAVLHINVSKYIKNSSNWATWYITFATPWSLLCFREDWTLLWEKQASKFLFFFSFFFWKKPSTYNQ